VWSISIESEKDITEWEAAALAGEALTELARQG
jgi:hypothetical protein